jgi:hypothetical protein
MHNNTLLDIIKEENKIAEGYVYNNKLVFPLDGTVICLLAMSYRCDLVEYDCVHSDLKNLTEADLSKLVKRRHVGALASCMTQFREWTGVANNNNA